LRNLESKVRPDILAFPDFDDNIREGFRRETEMLFGYILREDHSVLELLNADYTFVNERLAKHYGIPGVYGTRFRKVAVTDPNRPRPARPRQHSLADVGGHQNVARVSRQVRPDDVPQHAAAAAAAQRAGARGGREGSAKAPKTVREQLDLHRSKNAVWRRPATR